MATPVWDSRLPQVMQSKGFSGGPANTALRTSMDAGPDKVRRRLTANVRPVNGKLFLSAAEVGYLDTFYTTTTLGGSLRFSWVDPIYGGAVEMRFVEPPQWVNISGDWYEATLQLEVLP